MHYFSTIGMEKESVKNWIEAQPPGTVFSASDLPPSISRAVRDEMLSRFARTKGLTPLVEWRVVE